MLNRKDPVKREHGTLTPVPFPKGSPDQVPRLLTLKQAAAVLGLSVASTRRLIWAKKIPSVRILRRIQIDIRDLDRFIERSKER